MSFSRGKFGLIIRALICWIFGIVIIFAQSDISFRDVNSGSGFAAFLLIVFLYVYFAAPIIIGGIIIGLFFERSIARIPEIWCVGFTILSVLYAKHLTEGPETAGAFRPVVIGELVSGLSLALWLRLRPLRL
jgi:uncharacterized membrane protein